MNTRIVYRYHNAEDQKFYGEVVVRGEVTIEEILLYTGLKGPFVSNENEIRPVHLPFESEIKLDEPHYELVSVESTSEAPTINMTATELVERFARRSHSKWMKFGGAMIISTTAFLVAGCSTGSAIVYCLLFYPQIGIFLAVIAFIIWMAGKLSNKD